MTRRRRWLACVLLVSAGLSGAAGAHESQPGLLALRELSPDRYELTWRAPVYYGGPHPARVQLPEAWQVIGQPTVRQLPDSALVRQVVRVPSGSIDGSVIRFPGLEATITDRRWDMTYLGMQVLIEGLALAAFQRIRDTSTNPLAAAVNAYVMQDEARHVAFGRLDLHHVGAEVRQHATDVRSGEHAREVEDSNPGKRCARRGLCRHSSPESRSGSSIGQRTPVPPRPQ